MKTERFEDWLLAILKVQKPPKIGQAVGSMRLQKKKNQSLICESSTDEGRKMCKERGTGRARYLVCTTHPLKMCGLGLIGSPRHSVLAPFIPLEACEATLNRQQLANQMLDHCEWLALYGRAKRKATNEQGSSFKQYK